MQSCDNDRVGAVVRLDCDGYMTVRWADGCESQCYPGQLMLVANMVSYELTVFSSGPVLRY